MDSRYEDMVTNLSNARFTIEQARTGFQKIAMRLGRVLQDADNGDETGDLFDNLTGEIEDVLNQLLMAARSNPAMVQASPPSSPPPSPSEGHAADDFAAIARRRQDVKNEV